MANDKKLREEQDIEVDLARQAIRNMPKNVRARVRELAQAHERYPYQEVIWLVKQGLEYEDQIAEVRERVRGGRTQIDPALIGGKAVV